MSSDDARQSMARPGAGCSVAIVAGWLALAAALWLPAPRIPTLLEDNATSFFPDHYPSRRAAALLHREFPGETYRSQAAVVISRQERPLGAADFQWIADVSHGLRSRGDALSWRVRSPVLNPMLSPLMTSRDGHHSVITIDLPADMLTPNTVNRVRVVQAELRRVAAPPGLLVDVTGGAALAELLDATVKRDVDRTTIWAFAAVGMILILVYRAPVAVLLPIVTIAVSLMVSLGGLGFAAARGLPINGLVEMFLIVVVAGCGVDYCLFLFARFQEEAESGAAPEPSLRTALAQSRGSILASGATNVAGLGALALGANRDLHTSGPAIAAALIVVTMCVVTFTPAMMRLVGRALLRTDHSRVLHAAGERRWAAVARIATRRPGRVAWVILVLLSPFALAGRVAQPVFDPLEEFPSDSSFVRGARRYAEGFFGVRDVCDLTFLVSLPNRVAADDGALRGALVEATRLLKDRFPVLYARHLHGPLGGAASSALAAAGSKALAFLGGDAADPAHEYYVGASGSVVRVDLGLAMDPRSAEAMAQLPVARDILTDAFARQGLAPTGGVSTDAVSAIGETARYDDLRALQRRDFRVVAAGATAVIGLILVVMLRSVWHATMLIGATLLAYAASYGATWLVCKHMWGLPGVSYQVDFLLFIVMLSLGQDYNIYVVARIREELRRRSPRRAVETAVRKTGRVVSSCGLIMAAAFGSLYAGTLALQQQVALALSLGILLDTFLVRPLLVPSALLAFGRLRGRRSDFTSEALRREVASRAAPMAPQRSRPRTPAANRST